MNRLTKRAKNGLAYIDIPLNQSSVLDVNENIVECYTGFIADRLAAYEDTGLEPEEVEQYKIFEDGLVLKYGCTLQQTLNLLELYKQGLLIKLPCKVEDDVYLIHNICNGKWTKIEKVKFGISLYNYFGKTVFLTREEAEKALKEMEGKQ